MDMTIAEIATLVKGTVHGDPGVRITGVNGIMEAQPGDLAMVRDQKYAARLADSHAAAVLMAEVPEACRIPVIKVANPDLAFAQVLQHIERQQRQHPVGIDERAVVSPSARLAKSAALGAHVYVGPECDIGEGVVLYPGVVVCARVRIGAGTILYPNVTLREDTEIGARCIVHANSSIGSDGFGYVPWDGHWAKVPQVGRVVIGDDVEIGSNTAIDRAKCGETRIGHGTKIDNCVQVGHNVQIGEHCVLAGMVGIAGSAIIGNHVRLAASSGIAGHLTIGDGATIGARAGVVRSVPAGAVVSGFPAIDHVTERRAMVARERLPALLRRVRQLERRLATLEKGTHEQAEDDS